MLSKGACLNGDEFEVPCVEEPQVIGDELKTAGGWRELKDMITILQLANWKAGGLVCLCNMK